MNAWSRVVLLAVGGALGTNARYWLGGRPLEPRFPWATFGINVSGSFAIGFLSMALARWLPLPSVRLLGAGRLPGRVHDVLNLRPRLADPPGERADGPLPRRDMAGSVAAGLVAVAMGVGLAHASIGPAGETGGE